MHKAILAPFAAAAVVSAVAVSAAADPAARLTFAEFARKVEAHYPLLQSRRHRADEAVAARHEAVAGFLPRFTGTAEWTAGDDPVYVFGTLLNQGRFTAADFDVSRLNDPDRRSNLAFGVEGRWTLFDAFGTISRVRSASRRADSGGRQAEFAAMEARLVSVEAFYRAVLQENLLSVARETLDASIKDLSEAESLNRQGMVLGADFFAAKVNGGAIERMKNRFERDAESSRILLNILMGEDPLAPVRLDYGIAAPAAPDAGFSGWLRDALLHRKDLEAARLAVEAAEAESFRSRMSFLPRLDAFARVEENSHGEGADAGNYLLGVSGAVDLFDPAYAPRAGRAAAALRSAEAERDALADAIAASIAEESGRCAAVTADQPVAERMMGDARNAMEQTEKLYREGKKSVADLLEIRRVYLETAVKALETRFYARTSHSRLLFLSGRLDAGSAQRAAAGLEPR